MNNILVVDDTSDNLRLLVGILGEQNYNVRAFSEGKFALESARANLPDLILLDIKMPGMDGYEVCERLKADERTRDIPVIFISALQEVFDKVKAFEVGGVDYITKPFQPEEVLARVNTHLRIRKLQQQLEDANRTLEQRVLERTAALETLNNALQEELKKREQQQQLLIQRSKLESLGKMAAGIAHEINQPLTGISMGLDNILFKLSANKVTDDYLRSKIDSFLGDVARIKHIIEHVRTFSRDQTSVVFEHVDVNKVCRNALSMLHTQYAHHNISIEVEFAENIGIVIGNPYKLEQVLLNLIANAKDAVDEKEKKLGASSYRKQITMRTFCKNSRISIEIEDNGTGMPDEVQQQIFDPFFTTKDPEHGTGLGLSISYGIIKEMKGEISVRSQAGEYTIMQIVLPEVKTTGIEYKQE